MQWIRQLGEWVEDHRLTWWAVAIIVATVTAGLSSSDAVAGKAPNCANPTQAERALATDAYVRSLAQGRNDFNARHNACLAVDFARTLGQ